jgi:hypothetical protein
MAKQMHRESSALPHLRRGGMAWQTAEYGRRLNYRFQRVIHDRAAAQRGQNAEATA